MDHKFQFAKELICRAGQFVREQLDSNIEVEIKTNYTDLVTNIDKATQSLMMDAIFDEFPNDKIFAEENNCYHPIDKGSVWVIDPIDGTVNFVVQQTDFAIMLAYYEEGVGKFGLIYDVMNDSLLSGGPNFPVKRNQELVLAYRDRPLSQSLIGTNSGMFSNNYYGIKDLARETLGIRVIGSAGISAFRVLTGSLLAYFSYISPWDYAAAKVIGEALGYQVLTLDWQEPNFKEREKIMMIPSEKVSEFKEYIKQN